MTNEYAVVQGKKYTMTDIANFFKHARGFPSVLYFGSGKNAIAGEGQSGGRAVTEHVKAAENQFVSMYGHEGYQKRMDKLVHPERYR